MKKAELKSFGKPDEVREFAKGRLELMKVGGSTIGRAILQPGYGRLHRVRLQSRRRVDLAFGHSNRISRTSPATRSGAAVAALTSSTVMPGANSRRRNPSASTSIHARSVITDWTHPSAVAG
jgi:hypothetical protein